MCSQFTQHTQRHQFGLFTLLGGTALATVTVGLPLRYGLAGGFYATTMWSVVFVAWALAHRRLGRCAAGMALMAVSSYGGYCCAIHEAISEDARSVWNAGGDVSFRYESLLRGFGPRTRIDIVSFSFVDKPFSLACLKDTPEITFMNLRYSCIKDGELRHLRLVPQVRWLDLEDTQITDAGMRHMVHLRYVEKLNLSRTRVSDDGMRYLSHMKDLTVLDLGGTNVSGKGLVSFASLEHLTELDISDTGIEDAAIEAIAGLSNLTIVWMDGTSISDDGLAKLANSQLRIVGVGETRVTTKGIQELKGKLPGCRVYDWRTR